MQQHNAPSQQPRAPLHYVRGGRTLLLLHMVDQKQLRPTKSTQLLKIKLGFTKMSAGFLRIKRRVVILLSCQNVFCKLVLFLPRDAILEQYVLWSRVRLSQAGIVSKRLDESRWFWA